MRRREAVVFLLSAALLADEVVLVRAFSIGLWHHFAYMVISIALLGFGASGTLLAALARANKTSEAASTGGGPSSWITAGAVSFAILLPLSFATIQKIPFEPHLLVWEHRQWLYLACYYLVLFLPFFAAATAIGLALISRPADSPRLYFHNLLGSGIGALMAVGLLQMMTVEHAVLALSGLAEGAGVLALVEFISVYKARRGRVLAALSFVLMTAALAYYMVRPFAIRLSPYKGLSYALNLPDAQRVLTRSSAIGRVDVVASSAIRQAPGLSLIAPTNASIPPQFGIFVDGEVAGAITAFNGNTGNVAYLDWMSTAAHSILAPDSPDVCVLGAGGGASVLLALRHGAHSIDAVELDPNVDCSGFRGKYTQWSTFHVCNSSSPRSRKMPSGTGRRVLVVDDERMIADTLTLILNRSGYQAHAAYSGEDAIELAGSLMPDILVSDVVMGGMSGIEVAIYFANYLPKCRIILISGNILTASLLEVAGKQGYQFQLLPKPVHPQVLISHLSGPKA